MPEEMFTAKVFRNVEFGLSLACLRLFRGLNSSFKVDCLPRPLPDLGVHAPAAGSAGAHSAA